jgi:hypothetical protein
LAHDGEAVEWELRLRWYFSPSALRVFFILTATADLETRQLFGCLSFGS